MHAFFVLFLPIYHASKTRLAALRHVVQSRWGTKQVGNLVPFTRTPSVAFIDDHLPLLLVRAATAVSGCGESSPNRLDVTAPAGRVLIALADYPKSPVGRLAELCLLQQPTVTKLVAALERDELVRRYPDSRDKRVVRVALTSKGRAVVGDLQRAARQFEADLLNAHPQADEIKEVLRALIAYAGRGSHRLRRASPNVLIP